jgi:hypothetical protein
MIDEGYPSGRDPTEHAYHAVDYLERQVHQLRNSELGTVGNLARITDILREESRRLREVLRGSLPGGSASAHSS